MSSDRQSVPVSLPPGLVDRLDGLVEDGVFGSRSEALRYGARLVVREAHHERADSEARADSKSGWTGNVYLDLDVILAELESRRLAGERCRYRIGR